MEGIRVKRASKKQGGSNKKEFERRNNGFSKKTKAGGSVKVTENGFDRGQTRLQKRKEGEFEEKKSRRKGGSANKRGGRFCGKLRNTRKAGTFRRKDGAIEDKTAFENKKRERSNKKEEGAFEKQECSRNRERSRKKAVFDKEDAVSAACPVPKRWCRRG